MTVDGQAQTKERLDLHARKVKERLEDFDESFPEEKLNEQQTRTLLINTFIGDVLGYNLLNTADVLEEVPVDRAGAVTKTVDYAISGKYVLVEAKPVDNPLGREAEKQIRDAIAGSPPARFGLLTNGIKFKWFRCPHKEIIPEVRPFLEHTLGDSQLKVCEWLAAVSKNATDRDNLERLAWRLSLENEIREWLVSTFVDPVDPAIINKAVGLKVPMKDHTVVVEAATSVWRELRGHRPLPPPDHLEVVDLSDQSIDLGEDASKVARAWRMGNGNWQVENNAIRVAQSVLQRLLQCDARRDRRDQLAGLPDIVIWNSARGKAYKRIPGFTELCFDAYIPNHKKVQLLQNVSNAIDFSPPADHPLSKQPRVEVWMPTGTTYTKGR